MRVEEGRVLRAAIVKRGWGRDVAAALPVRLPRALPLHVLRVVVDVCLATI